MPAAADPEISVSIVSMNNEECLRRCLRSLYDHHEGLPIEVIVVFYRTPPEQIARIEHDFPDVTVVISEGATRGYGENQNLGLRRARGRYRVILNDDIVFHDDSLRQLRDYHRDHPAVAALLPKLLNDDGTVQVAIRGHFTPVSFTLNMLHLNPVLSRVAWFRDRLFDNPRHDSQEPVATASGSGAFFWIRSDVLERVGYMDERYFLAPDDVDLSIRISKAGELMMYLPDVRATHSGSRTLSKVFSKVLPVNLFGTRELFRIHYGRATATLVSGAIGAFSVASTLYWSGALICGDRARARTMLRGRANLARFMFAPTRSTKEIFEQAW